MGGPFATCHTEEIQVHSRSASSEGTHEPGRHHLRRHCGDLLETLFVVALMFFAINFPLPLLSRRLEARQPRAERVHVRGEESRVAEAVEA